MQEALYTDPYDQSIWFYHAFLCTAFATAPALTATSVAPGLTTAERAAYRDAQVAMVRELREDAKDCKWIAQTLVNMSAEQRRVEGRWPKDVSATDVKGWLDDLEALDPLRKGRWKDMRASLGGLLATA